MTEEELFDFDTLAASIDRANKETTPKRDCGWVVWDACDSHHHRLANRWWEKLLVRLLAGYERALKRESIVGAFMLGFGLCKSDGINEVIYAGRSVTVHIRSLRDFKPAEKVKIECGATFFGTLRNIKVYQTSKLPSAQWRTEVDGRQAGGVIINDPHTCLER